MGFHLVINLGVPIKQIINLKNDKIKEDVLANLYDQLLVLSEEYDLSNI